MADPITVLIEDPDDHVRTDPLTGTIETDLPDGSVVVQLDAHRPREEDEDEFYANLAEELDHDELGKIADQLIQGIEADDRSRSQYLQVRSKGLEFLGLQIKEPSKAGDPDGSVAGQSKVYNPLLLEAILKGWANARGELLPAEGPVKVRVSTASNAVLDDLAETLERDLNDYLTVTATEYYPDTSHMLLWGTYFGGSGFKKVYRCPLRRRPVSESVDCQHLIVSDATKDFRSCARITHVIAMRPSVLKRMQLIGAYRDVAIGLPRPQPNPVDQKINTIQGVEGQQSKRPEDQDYTIWETQCELDLPEFAPKKFKGEGIPLPYRATIDKDSRQILALRRDWRPEDEDCNRRRLYVKYPYVPGPGFYGTGLLQILGNSSAAMTAAWREALDAGMFASFPGGLIAKEAMRQSTNNFRASPGEFVPIQTNGLDIRQVVMPYPYKDVTGGLMSMMDKIEQQSARLGGAVEIATQEGIANVPVGTMIAQIEQATKVMAAAHRDMHQSQAEEIGMLVELFRDHPDDFLRSSKRSAAWNAQKFEMALQTYELVPRSDPNTPSHIHRTMKAVAYTQLMGTPLGMYLDGKEVARRVVRALRDEPEGIIIDPPPQQGDPSNMMKAMASMQDSQTKAKDVEIKGQKIQSDAILQMMKGKQEIGQLEAQKEIERIRLERERVTHQADALRSGHDMGMAARKQKLDERRLEIETAQSAQEMQLQREQHRVDMAQMAHDRQMAEQKAMQDRQMAQQKLDQSQQSHQQKMDIAKQKAAQRPKPKGQ